MPARNIPAFIREFAKGRLTDKEAMHCAASHCYDAWLAVPIEEADLARGYAAVDLLAMVSEVQTAVAPATKSHLVETIMRSWQSARGDHKLRFAAALASLRVTTDEDRTFTESRRIDKTLRAFLEKEHPDPDELWALLGLFGMQDDSPIVEAVTRYLGKHHYMALAGYAEEHAKWRPH